MKSVEENYSILPEHMRGAARDYVERGLAPGSFLTAVLSNNLKEAFGRADHINTQSMSDWARWLIWYCPSGAQGSPEKVAAWIERGGLECRPK